MSGYILTILGIVIAGVLIDIIVPSGAINKYIKSVFAIFVVAVILMPVIKFISNKENISINYSKYEIDNSLINYIYAKRVESIEKNIVSELEKNGFYKVDIKINYSINSDELSLNSCEANLKNMTISSSSSHINSYQFIAETVKTFTNLSDEVIIFYE